VVGRKESNDAWKFNELIFQVGLRSTFRQLYYDF
jgi:hypothetical protein